MEVADSIHEEISLMITVVILVIMEVADSILTTIF